MSEDVDEVSTAEKNLIHDGFDDNFVYKSVEPFVVKPGEVLNYLEFNFEENITISIDEDQTISQQDDFDYNQVPTVYKTDGVIDYYAPIEDLSLGYFGFIIFYWYFSNFPLNWIIYLKPNDLCRNSLTEPITIESCSDDDTETETETETKKKFGKAKKKPKEKFRKQMIVKVAPKSYEIKKGSHGK